MTFPGSERGRAQSAASTRPGSSVSRGKAFRRRFCRLFRRLPSSSGLPPAMVSLLCCGPKMAACGIVLSVWGVIMLVLLGIFFNVHSAVLIEDVPTKEEDFKGGPSRIYGLYEQVSYNCFIAAGLYVLLGGFSFCQVRLNKRKEYMVR